MLAQAIAEAPVHLPPWMTIVWVVIGILISLILPLAVKALQQATPRLESTRGAEQRPTIWDRLTAAWQQYGGVGMRYLWVMISAIIVAVVLVFLLRLEFSFERDAALAGFAWESFVHKLFGQQQNPADGAARPVTRPPA